VAAAARAQQRSVRIGILLLRRAVPPKQLAIRSELARLCYDEGRRVSYEIRGADGELDRLPTLTRELVATKPDVLVGASEVAADALAKVGMVGMMRFEARVRELVETIPDLAVLVEPLLVVRRALRRWMR
jgi:hypothetical protein